MKYPIADLLNGNRFLYQKKHTPKDNYLLFQQAISFGHRVEFLKTSSFSNKPMLYLIKVPALSTELDGTEKLLQEFNENALDHLGTLLEEAPNLHDMFAHFYELEMSARIQHQKYALSREKFFGTCRAIEFEMKDLRDLLLPVIPSHYKGLFLEKFRSSQLPEPINYADLGTPAKKHLEKIYLLRRRYNLKLLNSLMDMGIRVFKDAKANNYYHYDGNKSDLIETAKLLIASGNVKCLNGKDISSTEFTRDFALSSTKVFPGLVLIRKQSIKRHFKTTHFFSVPSKN